MLDVIMHDILGTPAILVGLFAFIGLLIQKKSSSTVLSGTLKTIMGFVILGAGATVLIGSLDHFSKMFDHAFQVQGVIPNNEAIVAAAQTNFGTATALIMVFGMIMNLLFEAIYAIKIYLFNWTSYIIYGLFNRRFIISWRDEWYTSYSCWVYHSWTLYGRVPCHFTADSSTNNRE